MATNNLLNQPAPGYRRFVDNQVLTDNQLNEVLDHLNYQDRLSRLLLHGVGTVCGLKISYNSSDNTIHLTKGIAVTTAGDLLKADGQQFSGFRKFDDTNVKYPVFVKDESDSIGLWALAADTSPSDVHPLNTFKSKTDIRLQDAVAVLYFEDYLDEEKDCSAVDCDTQGQPVINRLRVLLVSPDEAQRIAEQDSIFSGFLQKETEIENQTLSRHFAPRILLNKSNTRSFTDFKNEYKLSFRTMSEKIEALGRITIFEEALGRADINPSAELLKLSPTAYNFQYHYDFYKDLTTAYNELRALLRKQISLCCPDPEAFPKHVLLGELTATEKILRHKFYPSPTHGKPTIGYIISVYERILYMIEEFSADVMNGIKITPSRDEHYPLGRRAAPFYYNLEKSDRAAAFLRKWNGNEEELTPNYYEVSYPDDDFDPLDTVLDGHDFYRVEGHVGKNVRDAHKQLQSIRNSKSLPFDIKPVAIGRYPEESLVDFDKYRVNFEDLQVVLEAWNEEQQCLVRSATSYLSGFSTKEPGKHTAYQPTEKEPDDDGNVSAGTEFTGMVYQPVYTPLFVKTAETHEPKAKKTTYKKSKENQVIKSYSKAEESFGLVLNDYIKAENSKNDIIVDVMEWMPPMILNWNSDIREATITIPAQLIGYLKEVEDYKLTDIGEFSDAKLNTYLEALNDLCNKAASAINRLQHMIAKEQSEIDGRIWLDDYLHLLNRIVSSRCLVEKIKVLYETINERKVELFSRLTLHNFIGDHPGAEHKAGVDRGGTFILLYYSKSTGQSQQRFMYSDVQNFSLMTTAPRHEMYGTLTEAENRRIEEMLAGRRYDQPGEFVANIPNEIINTGERLRPSLLDDIPHGTVVGDLCLPYVCCSDTPSTTFVFPDQLATLRLPVDHVCVDAEGNTELIAMTVMPADGTVKAFIGEKEITDAISRRDNGVFFDPNKVKREDYGETIRFEVNSQAVDPLLHVVQKPKAQFTVSENITFERNNSGAVLTIQNSSVPFDEIRFEWNIDGHILENENATEFKHTLKVRPGQELSVEIELTAMNEYCKDTYKETVNISVPATEEPSDPNEPERNCNDITVDKIKRSAAAIRASIEEHQNSLGVELLRLYPQVNDLYKNVIENHKPVLAGEWDDNIIGMIQGLQINLLRHPAFRPTRRSPNIPPVQRIVIFQIFYHLILLYFHIHGCREGSIGIHSQISDVVPSWVKFTKTAIEESPNELKKVLSLDPVHEQLQEIQKQMNRRFDSKIKKIVTELNKLLKDFSGRR